MASLQPFPALPSRISFQNGSKSNRSISILQSRQLITELENTLEQNPSTSSAANINRQVNSGMVIDFKTFEPGCETRQHLIARNGEGDDSIIFSFIVLDEDEGNPSKVIYRWVRRQTEQSKGLALKEEEHIYKGEMKAGRKHGKGEYIVLKKWNNATETQQRYRGIWVADIFDCGSFENENGEVKEIKKSGFTTFKSKSVMKGKSNKNLTIKQLTENMGARRSSKVINQRESNLSAASILNKLEAGKVESSMHTIML